MNDAEPAFDHGAHAIAEMGEAAARKLLALIAGQRPSMRVVLPHQLIVRHSVGAPRLQPD
jgi:DNA-binding LacI/PurR family transcriptional regulator